MASDVNLLLATVLDAYQVSVRYADNSRATPPTDTAWAAPGANGRLEMGYDGTNAWATGAILCGFGTLPALSSGQAIAYVRFAFDTDRTNYVGNEHIANLVNQNTTTQSEIFHQYTDGSSVSPHLAPPGRAAGADWRTDINNLRMQVDAYRGNATPGVFIGDYAGLFAYVHVRNRPTLTVTAPSPISGSTITNTARPTIQWNFSGDGLGQSHFRVRVFTAAQYSAGGFNPQTSAATYDSGWTASTSTSHTLPSNLANGTTYRAYVMAAQTLPTSLYRHETVDGTTLATLGSSQYAQFTINLAAPPVPTDVQPASGSTQNTDLPNLRATLGASTVANTYVRAEWQLATDAGFTANVRTITQASTEQVSSGTVTKALPSAAELFQGTWYIRARALDSNGLYSAYTTAHSFTVSHPPTAIAQSPSSQVSRVSGSTTFAWTFSDTSPTDTQTAFQIIVERDSDGVQLYDSGKVAQTTQSYAMTISTAYNDVLLRWKVRVWDSDDVVGAYSANAQWYPRQAPIITVVSPTATVTEPQPTYSFTIQAGRTISQYRFITYLQGTSTIVDDSGSKTGTVASYQVVTPLQNATNYTVVSSVIDTGSLDASASTNFLTQWVPPDSPVATVDQTLFDTTGRLRVSWPQNRDASFYAYRIYGKKVSETTFKLRAETTDTVPATYAVDFYDGAANEPYQIVVTQVAYRYGVLVESSLATNVVTFTPTSTHYFLIVPDNTALNVRLSRVHEDSFVEEYEQATIALLDRGRRVEKGTRWGFRGSLSGSIRDEDGETPTQARAKLEAIRAQVTTLVLRNPFGDVWTVAVKDIEMERESGVGTNQYLRFSFEYEQVAD